MFKRNTCNMDHELFAADAGNMTCGAKCSLQIIGQCHDDLVADCVAMAVVDPFEVVYVKDHDHTRYCPGMRFFLQRPVQSPPVQETGKRVAFCLVAVSLHCRRCNGREAVKGKIMQTVIVET